jgi:hypothetical protein
VPSIFKADLDELEKLVEEMLGTELDEVSVVDQPATDRRFRLFKRVAGTQGRSEDMPATKADTARLGALLKQLAKAVPEGVDRETFERCVGDVMDKIDRGELAPQEGRDPKQTAVAICTESGAGKGTKQDPIPGEELPPEPPGEEAVGDTVEIPASPEKWPFSDCIAQAMELGFDQDSSIAVCQIIRKDYGDPEDPETVLVPDGSSTESLLAAAAIFGGIAKPEGLAAAAPETPPEQAMRFSGKNQWLKKFRRFLGLDRKVHEDAALARTRREVRKLMAEQQKTKDDLREMVGVLRDLLTATLRAQGIEVPPATGPAIMPPVVAEETANPEPEPGAAEDPAKRADPQVVALMAEVARLRSLIEAKGVKSAPEIEDGEEGVGDGRIVPDPRTAADLTPAPTVAGRTILRKSVDPNAGNGSKASAGAGAKHYSTYLNAHYPQEDFETLGPRR